MDFEVARNAGLDLIEELPELTGTMLRVAAADDGAGGDVERGEEGGCAMAGVVVGAPLHLARTHRQQGLRAIQGPDLRLLIHAKHQRPLGRRQRKADDIAHLLDKQGSFDSLKASVWCGCRPNARQMRWIMDGA